MVFYPGSSNYAKQKCPDAFIIKYSIQSNTLWTKLVYEYRDPVLGVITCEAFKGAYFQMVENLKMTFSCFFNKY